MGVDLSFALSGSVAVQGQHWQASSHAGAMADRYRQTRSDLGLQVRTYPGLTLEVGWAQRKEDHGVLGSSSGGALDLGAGLSTTQFTTGVTFDVGDHVQWIARYERGRGSTSGGDGLIRSLRGLDTEQYLAGLQFSHDRHQAVLMLSRPLHVTGGTLHLDVPTGRDIEGNIHREQRNVKLAADGVQTDIELGYAFVETDRARFQLNLLHTVDPQNLRSSGRDTSWALAYSRRF